MEPDSHPTIARRRLRQAHKDLTRRGLLIAAKWSAELVCSVREESQDDLAALQASETAARSDRFDDAGSSSQRVDEEDDVYTLAMSHFNTKSFDKTADLLQHRTDRVARFLGLYAKYLSCERQAQERAGPILGPRDRGAVSPDFVDLLKQLKGEEDAFLLYLKALVLARLGHRVEAMAALIHSGNLYPYNWSCWLKLAQLLEHAEEWEALHRRLPISFMSRIFALHAMLELHSATDQLHGSTLELLELFPTSLHIKSQQALMAYHLREFEEAERLFEEIYEQDPHRVEDIDTYSNILYVMDKRSTLSVLAAKFTSLDRNRPETCCLVGNYYSLRGEHEKALMHFRRALELDRGYLSAWTLMGHEFVELKNSHAAVAAYRRAVDVNRKDYRAWYGLGQTYELLKMPHYSLVYYQKATALRPYDSRMWSALAGTYDTLNRPDEAIKCYKRAAISAEPSEIAQLYRLAELYQEKDLSVAWQYHRRVVEVATRAELPISEYSASCTWLAVTLLEKIKAEGARLDQASEADLQYVEELLQRVLAGSGQEREDAKELLKQTGALRQS
ncbi:uncharacterized protein L969DRAFT_85101 [Mixia osmundae IAM 14324]|uniref:Cdc23 domain-containing protein n=1 Tax=Mixia osmundae (strain CBS 9802 / IAM 14324 / JCM 22182 / KY 12970) TaxID=764103 RepID=G7DXW0_MIXOS|nr:uncharacterized protein L969DRAFT_85101 [Mixia osmundae IAM 14324]KEI41323.1 hypothetical protein L969DRAFT_85101 [Mixia osmundae IAM 14324]GAA95420.1 hypothetical protein E5Q_02074 [Mixia osmundae IAM 14324]